MKLQGFKQNDMDTPTLDATLTADEALIIVGKGKISRGAWYAAINRNEVPHLRIGRRILIPRRALMTWLEGVGTCLRPVA